MFCRKFLSVFTLFVFFLFFSTDLFAQIKEDDEIIKVDVSLVNIPFSVSDREGRNILGLTAENFTLSEDGNPQKIEYLSTEDAPLNVVLLLDTSQSALDKFEKIKNAAGEFVKQLRPSDKCMIVGFDSSARVKSEFTSDQKQLNQAIKRTVLSQKPGTLVRDAVFAVTDKELAKVKGRKAIVLITDGKDAGSTISQNDLMYRLAESDAPVYSILYETVRPIAPIPLQPPTKKKKPVEVQSYSEKQLKKMQADQQKRNEDAAEFLEKMSDVTGGRNYRKEIDNLSEAFSNIAEELRKQYLIGFYPDDTNYSLAKHRIKIKVDKKNAVIRMKNSALMK